LYNVQSAAPRFQLSKTPRFHHSQEVAHWRELESKIKWEEYAANFKKCNVTTAQNQKPTNPNALNPNHPVTTTTCSATTTTITVIQHRAIETTSIKEEETKKVMAACERPQGCVLTMAL